MIRAMRVYLMKIIKYFSIWSRKPGERSRGRKTIQEWLVLSHKEKGKRNLYWKVALGYWVWFFFYRWTHLDGLYSTAHNQMAWTHLDGLYSTAHNQMAWTHLDTPGSLGHTWKPWTHLGWTHLDTPGNYPTLLHMENVEPWYPWLWSHILSLELFSYQVPPLVHCWEDPVIWNPPVWRIHRH